MKPIPDPAQAVTESKTVLYSGSWLKQSVIRWRDPSGKPHTWETIDRIASHSAVVLMVTLRPSNRILIIRQYRPPVDAVTVEFPAGLIDPGETPEAAAVRELREETGYIGTICRLLPPSFSSPGLTGEQLIFVEMEADETAPENQNRCTDFDDSECIRCEAVEKTALLPYLLECQARGEGLCARLLMYACALNMR